MRKTTLAAVISSVLLGAVAAHADQSEAPKPQPATQESAQTPEAANTGTAKGGNESVGDERSNVDEKSSSGSYYPYSSGTVGDDPAKPTSTAAPPTSGPGEGDQTTATTTEQWWAFDADGDESLSRPEFEKATPTLVSRFDEIDVDRDKKLSRDEIRTWHESQKARMDADQGAGTRSTAAEPAAPTAPATAPSTAPATGEEPATSPPDTAGQ